MVLFIFLILTLHFKPIAAQKNVDNLFDGVQHIREHAIIVPFRDREVHVERFQHYMLDYLTQFEPDKFVILIIDQGNSNPFRRSWLFNVGYKIVTWLKPNISCIAFHDVDQFPRSGVDFTQCERPMHLCSENERYNGGVPYVANAGGVVNIHRKDWEKVNGMSNDFRGWGGEDDDLHERLRQNNMLKDGIHMFRPEKGHGRFGAWHDKHHTKRERSNYSRTLQILKEMKNNSDRWKHDGLNSVKFYTKSVHYHGTGKNIMHVVVDEYDNTMHNNNNNIIITDNIINSDSHHGAQNVSVCLPEYRSNEVRCLFTNGKVGEDGYTSYNHTEIDTDNNNINHIMNKLSQETPQNLPLEYIHIPKTGGTAIELQAIQKYNITWGACHFHSGIDKQCNPKNINVKNKWDNTTHAIDNYTTHSLWHVPPLYLVPNPYHRKYTFTIVRNPYDRVLSMYYCPWNGYARTSKGYPRSNNIHDAKTMNTWIQTHLKKMNALTTPQVHYVYSSHGDVIVNYVLQYETLEKSYAHLMDTFAEYKGLRFDSHTRVNNNNNNNLHTTGNLRLTPEAFSDATLALINEFYETDFNMLGYTKKHPSRNHQLTYAKEQSYNIFKKYATHGIKNDNNLNNNNNNNNVNNNNDSDIITANTYPMTLFICGYPMTEFAQAIFPEYKIIHLSHDHSDIKDSKIALDTFGKNNILIYGMHGECKHRQKFNGVTVFVNGESYGTVNANGEHTIYIGAPLKTYDTQITTINMYYATVAMMRIPNAIASIMSRKYQFDVDTSATTATDAPNTNINTNTKTTTDNNLLKSQLHTAAAAAATLKKWKPFFLIYTSSHCLSFRDAMVKTIMSSVNSTDVHIGGMCGRDIKNTILHKSTGYSTTPKPFDVYKSYKKYRFVIAAENRDYNGYITEKIVNAFVSGAIPIYYGTHDIFKLFNHNSFIFYDIHNPHAAISRIKYLEDHPEEYIKMAQLPVFAPGSLETYFSVYSHIGNGHLHNVIRKAVLSHIIHISRGSSSHTSSHHHPYSLNFPNGMKQIDGKNSWSQNGQDLFVNEYYKNAQGLTFFEVGGYDGEKFSNTLFLEKFRNWDGYLVEANPYTYSILKSRNRRAWGINTCISNTLKNMTFIISGSTTSAEEVMTNTHRNRINKDVNSYGKSGNPLWQHSGEKVSVKCVAFLDMMNRLENLNNMSIPGKQSRHIYHIDYFSLDVEGGELHILNSLPWDNLLIRLFSIEVDHNKDQIHSFMTQKGYSHIKTIGGDFIYERNISQQQGRKKEFQSNTIPSKKRRSNSDQPSLPPTITTCTQNDNHIMNINNINLGNTMNNMNTQSSLPLTWTLPKTCTDLHIPATENPIYEFVVRGFNLLTKITKKNGAAYIGDGGSILNMLRFGSMYFRNAPNLSWAMDRKFMDDDIDVHVIAPNISAVHNVWRDLATITNDDDHNIFSCPVNNPEGVKGGCSCLFPSKSYLNKFAHIPHQDTWKRIYFAVWGPAIIIPNPTPQSHHLPPPSESSLYNPVVSFIHSSYPPNHSIPYSFIFPIKYALYYNKAIVPVPNKPVLYFNNRLAPGTKHIRHPKPEYGQNCNMAFPNFTSLFNIPKESHTAILNCGKDLAHITHSNTCIHIFHKSSYLKSRMCHNTTIPSSSSSHPSSIDSSNFNPSPFSSSSSTFPHNTSINLQCPLQQSKLSHWQHHFNNMNAGILEKSKKNIQLAPERCSGMGTMGHSNFKHYVATALHLIYTSKLPPLPSTHYHFSSSSSLLSQQPQILFEIGTGCGAFLYYAQKYIPSLHVLGTDISENMLALARHIMPSQGPFCNTDSVDFIHDNFADGVVASAVIEYLPSKTDASKFVKNALRILKPGKNALFTLINDADHPDHTKKTAISDKLWLERSWWNTLKSTDTTIHSITIFTESSIYIPPSWWSHAGRYSVLIQKKNISHI